MLLIKKLELYEDEVKKAVEKLFEKAYKNQSDNNDLLLVILHGFYDSFIDETKKNGNHNLSPYVFGPGNVGLTGQTQYEFYDYFRRKTIGGEPEKVYAKFKKEKNWQRDQSVILQLEQMVYLKFWESDWNLKTIYNLCRLVHGEPYNWHKQLGSSRKNLIETEIKDKTRKLIPKFFSLIDSLYIRQLRNAIAHSQFWISGSHINLFNQDIDAGFDLTGLKIDEWEEIYTKTILLHNFIIGLSHEYEDKYRIEAIDKHFGLPVNVTKADGSVKREWIRLFDPKDKLSRWVWYKQWEDGYMPKFSILT